MHFKCRSVRTATNSLVRPSMPQSSPSIEEASRSEQHALTLIIGIVTRNIAKKRHKASGFAAQSRWKAAAMSLSEPSAERNVVQGRTLALCVLAGRWAPAWRLGDLELLGAGRGFRVDLHQDMVFGECGFLGGT